MPKNSAKFMNEVTPNSGSNAGGVAEIGDF